MSLQVEIFAYGQDGVYDSGTLAPHNKPFRMEIVECGIVREIALYCFQKRKGGAAIYVDGKSDEELSRLIQSGEAFDYNSETEYVGAGRRYIRELPGEQGQTIGELVVSLARATDGQRAIH